MIDDATETTTIRPLTEDELHAVAGGFSVYRYLEGVGEFVTGIKDPPHVQIPVFFSPSPSILTRLCGTRAPSRSPREEMSLFRA
jgi:hypothetical protein